MYKKTSNMPGKHKREDDNNNDNNMTLSLVPQDHSKRAHTLTHSYRHPYAPAQNTQSLTPTYFT